MWSGNYRRSPIFIFSQSCIVKKSTAAEKLGRLFNMSFRLVRTECKLLRCVLQSHGFSETTNIFGKFNLLWTGCHLKPSQLKLLSEFHKVNHFPRSYELTRKDRLAKNVQRMQRLKGLRYFDFVPASYILPEEFCELCSGYLQDKGPYIVKPIASSRGRGIYIVSHPEEIPYEEPVIVSRYISNPFLLDGFKFDVRLYAAVTSYEPLVVYLYEEGLVRFATVRYQYGTRHLKTQCMHLTNYSVNKKNFEFVQNDDANVEDFGNKWSLGALLRYLKSEGADVTGLMVRIEDIIVKSFLSVVGPIASACNMFHTSRSQCFELYGFDIIVDENFRPWLLEVSFHFSLRHA
ncbi:tubulin polyglutamylase TTLL5 [Paragonimus westermani]|uniref:Tubulin--tyrosine ligase-like protein 5 n=1 Tax=Paragonimus westermani TaxID=34504 RepID=A0A5J4P0K1_9TREM|nr:tubulin polyglutamylase TTLL5 [Paragonimus westermani]